MREKRKWDSLLTKKGSRKREGGGGGGGAGPQASEIKQQKNRKIKTKDPTHKHPEGKRLAQRKEEKRWFVGKGGTQRLYARFQKKSKKVASTEKSLARKKGSVTKRG